MKYIPIFLLLMIINTSLFAQKPGTYYIQVLDDHVKARVLTIDDAREPEDDFVWISPRINHISQEFTLEKIDEDFFFIRASNGYYVCVQNGKNTPFSTLETMPWEDLDHFKWKLLKDKVGYMVMPKSGGHLVVATAINDNDAFVRTMKWNGGEVPKWNLVSTQKLQAFAVAVPIKMEVATWPTQEKEDEEVEPVYYIVYPELDNINHTMHERDCRRLQGEIRIVLEDSNGNPFEEVMKEMDEKSALFLDWRENKKKDFTVRLEKEGFSYVPEVGFLVPKTVLDDNSLTVKLVSTIKGCHKGGSFGLDYNCDIDYSGVFRQTIKGWEKNINNGFQFYGPVQINAKKNGRPDPHNMKINIWMPCVIDKTERY